MTENEIAACCPPFDPEPWDGAKKIWKDKLFLQDRVASFLHIPLNFGAVMKRCMDKMTAADAVSEDMLVIADENSLWGADVYVSVPKDVPDGRMATISGTFLTKVFEGPYRNMSQWIKDMKRHVADKGAELSKLYFFYTTCPKCAKLYGKNYVVILAKIGENEPEQA